MSVARWTILAALAVLAGCMSAPGVRLASPAADAEAKQYAPPEGKANVYISRSGSGGSSTTVDVTVDGTRQGTLIAGTFCLVAVSPGPHEIQAATSYGSARLSMIAAEGKNLFFEVTLTGSSYAGLPSIGMVPIEQLGKLMISQGMLVQAP